MTTERKQFSSTINTAIEFTELKGSLKRIEEIIITIKEKNEEMADDLTKIKEAIYNPDQGIYSRLKDVEQKVKDHSKIIKLEQEVKELREWKSNISKLTWTAAAGIIGSIGLAIWNLIKGI
tara:strand:+ start:35 stop:397 length:363 start_codon:yes stop_codon:yes gene_type:complete